MIFYDPVGRDRNTAHEELGTCDLGIQTDGCVDEPASQIRWRIQMDCAVRCFWNAASIMIDMDFTLIGTGSTVCPVITNGQSQRIRDHLQIR